MFKLLLINTYYPKKRIPVILENHIVDIIKYPNSHKKKAFYIDKHTYTLKRYLTKYTNVGLMTYLPANPKIYLTKGCLDNLNYMLKNKVMFMCRFFPWRIANTNTIHEAWKKLFQNTNPQIILLTDEYDIVNKIGIAVAKEMGILSIALQHGIITPNHPGYNYPNVKKREVNNYLPDYLIVWGPYEKQIIRYPKTSKTKIIPLGSPQHDYLARIKFNREEILKKYKLSRKKKIILWPTQGHDLYMNKTGEWEKITNLVFDAFQHLKKEYQLVIKLHPNEEQFGLRYITKAILTHAPIKILPREANIHELIFVSDYVIIKHSTVGMESILMGVPVIIIDVKNSENIYIYEKCPKAHTSSQLVNIIKKKDFSGDSSEFATFRKDFIHQHFSNFGHASKEVGEFILNKLRILEKKKDS